MNNGVKGFIIGIVATLGVSIVLFFCGIINIELESSKVNYKPEDGYVQDEETAIKIAEAIWLPIYGKHIYDEKPFIAKLKNDVWTVTGTLSDGMLGGVAEIDISKQDGKILRVIHGM